jgi:hypothetical protein
MSKSLSELRDFALNKKTGETVYGYFFLRRISPFFTWLFIRAGVSPNTVTLMALFFALSGSLMFLSGSLMLWISGYMLYQVYYVLDCSDGEVAVATGNTSDFGAFLDKIGHPITNSAIIYFSAFGAYRITGSLPLLVISASGAIMFNLTSVMRYFVRDKTDSGSENEESSSDTGHNWFAEEDSSLVKLLKAGKNLATRPGGLTHPLAFLLLLDLITGGFFRVIYPAAASGIGFLLVLKRFISLRKEM